MYALQREPESRRRWHILMAGGTLGCAIFGATLGWSAQLPPKTRKPPPTVITMRVVETPKAPPAAEPSPIPEPKPEPPRELAARPVQKDPPQKLPKPSPLDPPPQATPEPMAAEPLALGITLSSTTTNGRGPRFAVGDSLMGEPDRIAKAPRPSRRVQPSAPAPARGGPASGGTSTSKTSVAAKLERSVQPAYPASARNLGLEGVVVLAITIGTDGRVQKARVLKGLGGGLDEAAVSAARRTVWQPATLGGQPVQSTRRFSIRFSLKG